MSVLVMLVSALAVFDLLVYGSAAAVLTGQATSPLPAVVFTALLLPGGVTPLHAAVAVLVVPGVVAALGESFAAGGWRRSAATVLIAASGSGLLTVLTKLLGETGSSRSTSGGRRSPPCC